jgi:hypothetical protein
MPNSYLNRTQEAATNRKKCTLSMWFKTTDSFGTRDYQLWETFYSASDRITVYIDSSDRLNWIDPSVSPGVHVGTNRKFRDPNAWYHVVFQIDTTESTASDRIKIYVNGVQETSLHSSTYYDQNDDAAFGTTNHINYIGKYGGNTNNNYNGYMSHVAFVDGSVVAPTVFGETDSTSGIWKFKPPSGVTWGNCGTHLKFENSAALGTDSSGNSNTFTVNGDLKQALDTPSNVHATWNPNLAMNGTMTLANGNTTGTTGSNYSANASNSFFSTLGVSQGKWYVECKLSASTTSGGGYFGVSYDPNYAQQGTTASNNTNFVQFITSGFAYSTQGTIWNGSEGTMYTAVSVGDILAIALDLDNNLIYYYLNGTLQNTGGTSITADKEYFFAISDGTSGNTFTWQANFGNGYFGTTAITSAGSNGNGSLFEYDVPSGYYALNTKNINTYG